MIESGTTRRWWSSPEAEFPAKFWADCRKMEADRLKTLLTGPNEESIDLEAPPSSVDEPVETDLWLRIRRAATLLELSALDNRWDKELGKIWEVIALIHEAIGVVDGKKLDYQWLLSALAWQMAEAPSIAALLATKLADRETARQRDTIERIAISFSRRDFETLRIQAEFSIGAGTTLRTEVEHSRNLANAVEAGMLLSMGTVMRDLATYVRFQSENPPDLSALEDYLGLAIAIGDSRRFRIGRLLAESVRKFSQANSRILIEQIPNLTDKAKRQLHAYLRQYPELWPSQRKAINRGLLDVSKRHFVVAVPTSSGKTLCGELVIIQELADKPNAVCFYVVPTRALVTEKSRELERKLGGFNIRVVAATGALQRDDIEISLFADAQIIVCTPEKLDLLIRHEDEYIENASLFIIDETQMISDDDRGLGLEFVVVKLLLLKPSARILLLSAMLPNSEQFGRWLSQEATVSSSDWRPTRQRFGEIEFRKVGRKGGSSLDLCLYDTSGQFDGVRIPVARYPRRPKSVLEMVIWAAKEFRTKGPVLVFCMAKPRCEDIAAKIVAHLKAKGVDYSISPAVENLRIKIKREIADHFLLSDALAVGVAYHHADLPARIRIDLESLIADTSNRINIIVSTTTLAEGVNLPISTVIFEDWMTRGDARIGRHPEPLDLSKFRNIAGRAGRAGKETEGLVLFLEPSRKPVKLSDGRVMPPRQYFVRHAYPAIQSRFLEVIEKYKIPEDSLLDRVWQEGDQLLIPEVRRALRQFGLAVLHAMEVLKLDDNTMIDRVIDRSLLAVQAPDRKDTARAWFGTWVRFYRRVDKEIEREELRPIAMQVGLPLRSVRGLYIRAMSRPELLGLFGIESSGGLILSAAQIQAATRIVAEIDELDWQPGTAPHSALLGDWLTGEPISSLVKMYMPHLAESERKRAVERTCNYATQQLSNAGAWGMYAFARILELILGEDKIDPMAKRLSLLTYFGVDSVPAALFCLMGVERIDALRLGKAFVAGGATKASIPLLKSWARGLGQDQVTTILREPDGREMDLETLRLLGVT